MMFSNDKQHSTRIAIKVLIDNYENKLLPSFLVQIFKVCKEV